MGRPLVLVPLGIVLLLVSTLYALGSIASHRWGGVVAEQRWCGTPAAGEGLCADRVEVELSGPYSSRREPGNEWRIAPNAALGDDRPHTVDVSDDGPLRHRGATAVVALVEQEERDVVALAVGDTVLPVNDVGLRGVLSRSGLGLMGVAAGIGCLLVGVRMRRDGGSWGERRRIQAYGSAWLALPVVAGFLLFATARLL